MLGSEPRKAAPAALPGDSPHPCHPTTCREGSSAPPHPTIWVLLGIFLRRGARAGAKTYLLWRGERS